MVITDAVMVQIIASGGTLVVALAGLIVSILNNRKIDVVKKATDGMKDQLVAATKSDSFQKGHTAGVAEEKSSNDKG